MPRTLLVATKNAHKAQEIQQILGEEWIVQDLNAFPNIPAPDETGITFAENAGIKAVAASLIFPGCVLSDDSGLEVDLLDGDPGVQSALYAGVHGDDTANRLKLIEELAPFHAEGNRCAARFRCCMAIAENGKLLGTFNGAVEGHIINEERGTEGFGYDSLFIPDGYEGTFAELPAETKNLLSHRARALALTGEFLSRRTTSA